MLLHLDSISENRDFSSSFFLKDFWDQEEVVDIFSLNYQEGLLTFYYFYMAYVNI